MKIFLLFLLILLSCCNKKTDNVKNQQNNILKEDLIGKNKQKSPKKEYDDDEKLAIEIVRKKWNNGINTNLDKEQLGVVKINDSLYYVIVNGNDIKLTGGTTFEVNILNKKITDTILGE